MIAMLQTLHCTCSSSHCGGYNTRQATRLAPAPCSHPPPAAAAAGKMPAARCYKDTVGKARVLPAAAGLCCSRQRRARAGGSARRAGPRRGSPLRAAAARCSPRSATRKSSTLRRARKKCMTPTATAASAAAFSLCFYQLRYAEARLHQICQCKLCVLQLHRRACRRPQRCCVDRDSIKIELDVPTVEHLTGRVASLQALGCAIARMLHR
jgi:hypothetical protein